MQAREQARENNRFSVLKNHPPHATLPPQARCATAPPPHEASERRAAAKRSNFSITAGERSEPAERSPIHLRPQGGRTTEQMPSPHATLPPQARCATAPPPHEASERRTAAKRSNYSITAGERSEPAEGSPHPPSAPRGSNHRADAIATRNATTAGTMRHSTSTPRSLREAGGREAVELFYNRG